MKAHIANLRVGVLQFSAYRSTVLFYLLSEFIILFAFYYLWRAVFASSPNGKLADITFQVFFAYLLAARLTARFITGPAWGFFSGSVRTGAVLYDLIQPFRLEWAFLIRQLSRKIAELSITAPIFVSISFILGIQEYVKSQFVWFFLSLILGFTCAYFFEMLISISAFYTTGQQGIHEAKLLAVTLLSGSLFPLELLPRSLTQVINLLPFKYFVYTPVQILLANTQGSHIIKALTSQLVWIIILGISTSYAMHQVRQYFDLHGG